MTPPETKYLIYVEDDPDDIEIFKEYFGDLDHIGIITFGNGIDLLEYISMITPQNYPCLIVLDINVPKMDGWETVAAIKGNEHFGNIPLMMFSTSTLVNERKRELYAVDVVTKPINEREAKDIAEKLLSYCNE
jgi:CheY-like chemotaxis protein